MPKKKTLEDSMRDKFYEQVSKYRITKKDIIDTKLTDKLRNKLRREMENARKLD